MRICFFGGSLLSALGDSLGGAWLGRLAAGPESGPLDDPGAYQMAFPAESTQALRRAWRNQAELHLTPDSEDLVVFCFDRGHLEPDPNKPREQEERAIEDARQMLAEASERYRVLVVSPPPGPDEDENLRIQEFTQQLKELCGDYSIPMLDLQEALKDNELWRKQLLAGVESPEESGGQLLIDAIRQSPQWQTLILGPSKTLDGPDLT